MRSSDSERKESSSILAVHGNFTWWAGCLGITAEQGLQDREWGKVLMQQGMPVSIAGNGNGNGNGSKEQRAKSKEQRAKSKIRIQEKPFHL